MEKKKFRYRKKMLIIDGGLMIIPARKNLPEFQDVYLEIEDNKKIIIQKINK